eukprot:797220-Rhodomonas_salina.5
MPEAGGENLCAGVAQLVVSEVQMFQPRAALADALNFLRSPRPDLEEGQLEMLQLAAGCQRCGYCGQARQREPIAAEIQRRELREMRQRVCQRKRPIVSDHVAAKPQVR